MIEVIRPTPAGNELVQMRWGFAPSWWKKPLRELPATFNARAETVAEKPMFRSAFKSRRCIIPASGFYEWTGDERREDAALFHGARRPPARVRRRCARAVAMLRAMRAIDSATIIVGPANGWMRASMIACRSFSTGATRTHG